MKNKTLKSNYEKAVNDYLRAFCDKHDFDYEDAKESWVGGDVGGIVCCADYFIDMQTIIDDIHMDAPEEEFIKWYDYHLELSTLGMTAPNFRSWLRGCPRKSDDEIQAIRDAQKRVEDAKEMLNDLINIANDYEK